MAAYVISEVRFRDEAAAKSYRELAASSIQTYGGRYLARAAVAEVAEGEPASGLIVIVEFPSMERLREWYSSADYGRALSFRDNALERRLLFVDGVHRPPDAK